MSNITNYYTKELDKLNKEYDLLTKDFLKKYVDFNVKQFKFGLRNRQLHTASFIEENNNNAYIGDQISLTELNKKYKNFNDELKARLMDQKSVIDVMQRNADELEQDNSILKNESENIVDKSLASRPFYNEERYMYYKSLIYIILLGLGSLGIIFLFKNLGVTGQVTNVAKDKAKGAIDTVKQKAQDIITNEESFNSMKNFIIALLVGILVISIFVFILYLIRRARPSDEDSETKKAIDEIADSCKKEKMDEWYKSLFKKITNFLAVSNEPQSN